MIKSIDSEIPVHTDRYFVDTNVWFWFTYCASKEIEISGAPQRYQLEKYPDFVEKVLGSGAKIYHCPLVYTELANIIERTEYEIYKASNSGVAKTRKEFRSDSECRKAVVEEIKMAWDTINSISNSLSFSLNNTIVNDVHSLFEESALDAYDAFYCYLMEKSDIKKIITDDADFNSVEGQELYTANRRIL